MQTLKEVYKFLQSDELRDSVANALVAWGDAFRAFGHDIGFLRMQSFRESALQSLIFGEIYKKLGDALDGGEWFVTTEQMLPGVYDLSWIGTRAVPDSRAMRVDILVARTFDGGKIKALMIEVKADFNNASVAADVERIETAMLETSGRAVEIVAGAVFYAWGSAGLAREGDICQIAIPTPQWSAESDDDDSDMDDDDMQDDELDGEQDEPARRRRVNRRPFVGIRASRF